MTPTPRPLDGDSVQTDHGPRSLCFMLFGFSDDDVPCSDYLPDDCMTARGYGWGALLRRYGLDKMRAAFSQSNHWGNEAAYHAEDLFIAWYKRKHRREPWSDRITTDW